MSKLLAFIRTGFLFAMATLAPPPAIAAPAPNTVCIRDPEIVRTDRPDDFTILFTLRNHQVWKNTLPTRCFGLHKETDGFSYQPTDPATEELCSNQATIRLNRYRSTCLLGAFTRIK